MPLALQNLSGVELTKALKSYIHRAQRGIRLSFVLFGSLFQLLLEDCSEIVVFALKGKTTKQRNTRFMA